MQHENEISDFQTPGHNPGFLFNRWILLVHIKVTLTQAFIGKLRQIESFFIQIVPLKLKIYV